MRYPPGTKMTHKGHPGYYYLSNETGRWRLFDIYNLNCLDSDFDIIAWDRWDCTLPKADSFRKLYERLNENS